MYEGKCGIGVSLHVFHNEYPHEEIDQIRRDIIDEWDATPGKTSLKDFMCELGERIEDAGIEKVTFVSLTDQVNGNLFAELEHDE